MPPRKMRKARNRKDIGHVFSIPCLAYLREFRPESYFFGSGSGAGSFGFGAGSSFGGGTSGGE